MMERGMEDDGGREMIEKRGLADYRVKEITQERGMF